MIRKILRTRFGREDVLEKFGLTYNTSERTNVHMEEVSRIVVAAGRSQG